MNTVERLLKATSWIALCGAVLGCHSQRPDFGTLPKVSVPLEFGTPENKNAKPVPKKQEPQVEEESQPNEDLPDPAPLYLRDYANYTVTFDKGALGATHVTAVHYDQPTPAARRMGRFAIELWLGAQLVERVRFDLPLLGGTDDADQQMIERGLSTQTQVQVPVSQRARRAFLLDRKTRERVELPWPPSYGELQLRAPEAPVAPESDPSVPAKSQDQR